MNTRTKLFLVLAALAALACLACNRGKWIHHNILLTDVCVEFYVPASTPLPLLWDNGRCESQPETQPDSTIDQPETRVKHPVKCEDSKTRPTCDQPETEYIPYQNTGKKDNTPRGPWFPSQDNYIL
jgi:hypothetical protein